MFAGRLTVAVGQEGKKATRKIIPPGFGNFWNETYGFQIMSATVLPAGMNGMTCVLYGTTTSRT